MGKGSDRRVQGAGGVGGEVGGWPCPERSGRKGGGSGEGGGSNIRLII